MAKKSKKKPRSAPRSKTPTKAPRDLDSDDVGAVRGGHEEPIDEAAHKIPGQTKYPDIVLK